jgi:hypothetical protein
MESQEPLPPVHTGYVRRGVWVVVRISRFHAIADAVPPLALLGAVSNTCAQRGGRERRQQRLVARKILLVFFRTRCKQPFDPPRGASEDAHHIAVTRWRQREEAGRLLVVRVRIGAVERERVEVQVQVQRGAEALNERDRAALLGAHAPMAANAPPQLGEERAHKGAQDLARELPIGRGGGAAQPDSRVRAFTIA